VKFGLYGLRRGSNVDRDVLRRRAIAAEEAGFESLWVGDHIVDPNPRLEALVALTYLAAVTDRVRLAVGVLVLPQRQPVLLTKQLTSIDALSRGRLIVGIGIGVGYVESELNEFGETLGRAKGPHRRAPRCDAGWLERIHESLRATDRRRRPFRRCLARAARVGDDWFGWDLNVDDAAAMIERLRRQRPDGFEITIKPKAPVDLETAREYAQIGADRLVLHPIDVHDDSIDDLSADAAENLIGEP
jgi:alkanesulfonate monooxygenase SsuD/methylene tetrahydromethanopterin reductase-like flavin-dependent oxidoreductase (luciferase family)